MLIANEQDYAGLRLNKRTEFPSSSLSGAYMYPVASCRFVVTARPRRRLPSSFLSVLISMKPHFLEITKPPVLIIRGNTIQNQGS